MSKTVNTQTKSVTDKFSRNLALLICDFVRSGTFKTSTSAIGWSSRPTFSRTDDDDDAELSQPQPDILIHASGTNRSYWCEVGYRMERLVSITYIASGDNCVTAAHTVPGIAVVSGAVGKASSCEIPIPEQLTLKSRTLDPDGAFQAIFDVTTRALFLSWPSPHVRENCVASFFIPEEVVRSWS